MKSISKIILLVCFVFCFAFLQKAYGQFFFMQNPLTGKEAPEFSLYTLKGEGKINLSEFRGDDSAIVFFWATWCPHCRTQIGELNTRLDEYEKKDVKVAFVNVGESAGEVETFLKRFNINVDVFLDDTGEVSGLYNVVGLPSFVFIGKDGKVKTVKHSIPDDISKIFWEE